MAMSCDVTVGIIIICNYGQQWSVRMSIGSNMLSEGHRV